MAAIHYYTRRDNSWSDHPACVSEVVRSLAIRLNDMCEDGEREELIGPHLWAPVGTATGHEDEVRRACLCADRAVRVWAPRALEAAGRVEDAARLRALPPVVDRITARAAANAAAYTAKAAAKAAAYAYAAYAYAYAATAAYTAAYTAKAAKAEILDLILECCAIGTRAEVCPTKTREEVIREACV